MDGGVGEPVEVVEPAEPLEPCGAPAGEVVVADAPTDSTAGLTASEALQRTTVDAVLAIWRADRDAERPQQRLVANWVLILLSVELAVAALIMLLLGAKWLEIAEWVAAVFFTAVFTSVAAMANVILKHVFRDNDELFIEMLKQGMGLPGRPAPAPDRE